MDIHFNKTFTLPGFLSGFADRQTADFDQFDHLGLFVWQLFELAIEADT